MQYLQRANAATSMPALGRWALVAALEGDDDALPEATSAPGARVARWTKALLGYAEAVRRGRQARPGDAEAAFRAADERAAIRSAPVSSPGHQLARGRCRPQGR